MHFADLTNIDRVALSLETANKTRGNVGRCLSSDFVNIERLLSFETFRLKEKASSEESVGGWRRFERSWEVNSRRIQRAIPEPTSFCKCAASYGRSAGTHISSPSVSRPSGLPDQPVRVTRLEIRPSILSR